MAAIEICAGWALEARGKDRRTPMSSFAETWKDRHGLLSPNPSPPEEERGEASGCPLPFERLWCGGVGPPLLLWRRGAGGEEVAARKVNLVCGSAVLLIGDVIDLGIGCGCAAPLRFC